MQKRVNILLLTIGFFFLNMSIVLASTDINLHDAELNRNETTATEITELASRNPEFDKFSAEIEKAYRYIAAGKPVPISFYIYHAKEDDKLMQIAARCNLPYEEIALLNEIESIDTSLTGKKLILPNAPGIFVPKEPVTSIGTLIKNRLYSPENTLVYFVNNKEYQYIPKERLTPTERAFFLDTSFKLPLEKSVLTSNYGMRKSPITGDMKFHKGIDLAAPNGTEVFACKSGVVANTAYDEIFGNFIILNHTDKEQSIYAHLSEILVKKGENIKGGKIIGKVGTTGASTGPHLHFEIRVNGKAQNPKNLLPSLY